jgi:hypothetical protein
MVGRSAAVEATSRLTTPRFAIMVRRLLACLCLTFALAGPAVAPVLAQAEPKAEEKAGGPAPEISAITYIVGFGGIILTLVVVCYPNRKT